MASKAIIAQKRPEIEVDVYGQVKKFHWTTGDNLYWDMPADAWTREFKCVNDLTREQCDGTMQWIRARQVEYLSCKVDDANHPHHLNWVLSEALRAKILSRIASM
jgi:hypothetical protein